MRTAYTHERLYRTLAILTTGYENLHERLPRAYDDGFGLVRVDEIAEVSPDLAVEFRAIQDLLSTERAEGESWAALSCAEMTPAELEKLAARFDDFFFRFKNRTETEERYK
jgi:hypothetical protein